MGLRVWLTSPCYQYSPGHLSPTQEAVSGLDLVVVVQDPWSVVVFGAGEVRVLPKTDVIAGGVDDQLPLQPMRCFRERCPLQRDTDRSHRS
jgi:hypothetical protein